MSTEPLDEEAISDAIHDWLVTVSEIVPRAIWANQNLPQPEYPYADMLFTGDAKEGGRDEIRTSFNSSRPLGEEIEIVSTGPVLLTLSVTFNVDAETLREEGPNSSAGARARKARSSLGQLPVLEHLRAAGLAVVRELGVQDTSQVINGEWLGRATFDVQLRATTVMTQKVGYIDQVELETSMGSGVDMIVDAGD